MNTHLRTCQKVPHNIRARADAEKPSRLTSMQTPVSAPSSSTPPFSTLLQTFPQTGPHDLQFNIARQTWDTISSPISTHPSSPALSAIDLTPSDSVSQAGQSLDRLQVNTRSLKRQRSASYNPPQNTWSGTFIRNFCLLPFTNTEVSWRRPQRSSHQSRTAVLSLHEACQDHV